MANEVVKSENNVIDMGGIFTTVNFDLALKMATSLSKSTIIPESFRNKVSDCVIAVDMAARTKMSPLMVMQNLYVVNGMPSWSSKFITALINNSGKYATPIQYAFNDDKTSCYCWVKTYGGDIIKGPMISIEMAKAEGWYDKKLSKWKTIPELMLMYRAASFFGKTYCADLLLGMPSRDEIIDGEEDYGQSDDIPYVEDEIDKFANGEVIGFDDTPEQSEDENNIDEPLAEDPGF